MENREYKINEIKHWMQSFACGYKHARPKQEIYTVLNLNDREFRDLCTEIPEVMTSSTRGYWWLKEDVTGEEYRVAREALDEDRRRVISLWKRNKMKRNAINELDNKNKQNVLFV